MNAVKRLAQDYAVGLLLVALFVYLSFASPQFLRPTNLGNVLEQTSLIGIIAMGVAVLMVSGNFDLSVGANVALSGICAAYALNAAGLGAAIVVGLGVSLLVGAINAILVVALGINSFMATLGMSAVLFGGALLVSSAAPVIIRTDALEDVVGARPLGIALPVWVFAAVVILAAWYLHFTVGGRETFAVGGNIEAARYGGVRTKLIRTIPFLLTGICCGISSLLLLGQINVALPDAAAAWALQVITAVVLGGGEHLRRSGHDRHGAHRRPPHRRCEQRLQPSRPARRPATGIHRCDPHRRRGIRQRPPRLARPDRTAPEHRGRGC